MLATGIRSNLGIKILGPDLAEIERIGLTIESLLQGLRGTRSAYSERVTGGYYLDVQVDRDAIARYGLTIEDVEDVIESAIGGKTFRRRSRVGNGIPLTSGMLGPCGTIRNP